MITTDPIGDWTWEITPSHGDARPSRAVEITTAIWRILAKFDLATPPGRISFSARPRGNMSDTWVHVQDQILHAGSFRSGTTISDAVSRVEKNEGDLVVSARAQCPGLWYESGNTHRVEQLFVATVDIWQRNLIVVTLETYSDAWLTMDTREREQISVHAQNAPRLAAALEEISAALGSAPTPGDPNRHATPTETGFEDPMVEGTAYADSWGTFEVPARSRRLRADLPLTENDYEEITDHPVRYFTIQREGRTIGYVWASIGDNAACYEPRTAAGDEAFEAGREWLLRLRTAHEQGLDAVAALDWLTRLPSRPKIGTITEATPQEAPSLDFLEELSGRY
ncbi:conserved hypothetical protein [Streptomyces himastatinicus ATCC 53653]|uniref:LigA protein n=1 Tax=Streptomyces himastatinicus ATCC 53653 TaxID=457427 RepID=D9WBQ7_9ACTN|nr:hypothetical protein [Streptomyces himastatinicus]EFL25013.1 conserved hypothetical protein [Streptomyces himastatinicus ATCC 53653]